MKPMLKYPCLLMLLISFSNCKKFLDVRPDSNQINPNTVEDFEKMLNNSALATPNYLVADLTSDDITLSDAILAKGGKGSFYANAYLWADIVWTASDDDPMYNDTYKSILQMNIVIDNIAKAKEGTDERKAIVNAQAKINRAYYYLQLANLYGNGYQSSNAGQDLAVPLVLHADPTMLPQRNTVKEVYGQVLADLDDALKTESLPDFGVDVIHPGKAAAFALLARTHLYMGNYEKALTASDAALNIRNTLLDYRTFSFNSDKNRRKGVKNKPFTLKDQQLNPENLFTRVCLDDRFFWNFEGTFNAGDDIEALYGAKDLRFVFSFDKRPAPPPYLCYQSGWQMQFNYSLGVPEMMLVKAECLARKGDGAGAVALLNQLRIYRFRDTDYTALDTRGTDVLSLVLDERRRELYMHGGMRLFDLKRLNNDAAFKKNLERKSLGDGSTIASLQAGSPRYLIPFAPKIIANNPLMVQNKR